MYIKKSRHLRHFTITIKGVEMFIYYINIKEIAVANNNYSNSISLYVKRIKSQKIKAAI